MILLANLEMYFADPFVIVVTSVVGLFGNNPSACDRVALETALQFVEYYCLKAESYQQSLSVLEHEEREATLLGKAGSLSVSLISMVQ